MRRDKLIRLALESKKVLVIEDPLAKIVFLRKGSILIEVHETHPVRMDVPVNRLTYKAVANLLELRE